MDIGSIDMIFDSFCPAEEAKDLHEGEVNSTAPPFGKPYATKWVSGFVKKEGRFLYFSVSALKLLDGNSFLSATVREVEQGVYDKEDVYSAIIFGRVVFDKSTRTSLIEDIVQSINAHVGDLGYALSRNPQ